MAEKERNDDNTGKSEGKPGHGKRILLRTFGCQMNVRDAEWVMGLFLAKGFGRAPAIDRADIIIFNSCSVRKHAEDKLFSHIAELKKLKKRRPEVVIGLMGCTAQLYKEKILRRAPLVDFVCGPGNENELPAIIDEVRREHHPVVAIDRMDAKRPELVSRYRSDGLKAFVSIGEGCDNFCSYCVVPYVRGRERSRHVAAIVREVRELVDRGFKDVTLLGQNVNSYGRAAKDDRRTPDFVRLLEKVNAVPGVGRIRFMTSHPKDASTDLFRAMRDLEHVCEHLHLPLQSGSDRILKLMNRKYTRTQYRALIDSYRKILPGGALTTDIIVGFPSETAADFRATVALMKAARFDSAFLFKYSPRPPAKAALLADDVTGEMKDERLQILLRLQASLSAANNAALAGTACEVLVEGHHEKEEGCVFGRTRTNKIAIFRGDGRLIGKTVTVTIDRTTPYALRGSSAL